MPLPDIDLVNVECRSCGHLLEQTDWNTALFLMFCDHSGCSLYRTPQAKRYKDFLGRPEEPVPSRWLEVCRVRLQKKAGIYSWVRSLGNHGLV